MNRIALTLAMLTVLGPGALEAQSIFSAAGLGVPVDAVGGRHRALGNLGVGLMGPDVSATDPSALGLMVAPSAIFTSQPSWVDFDHPGGGPSGSFQSSRFPMVGIAYPASSLGMMALTFSAMFDQRYQANRDVTVDLSEGPIGATDSFLSDGGVSRLNLSWGRSLNETLSVGLSAGRYTGKITRRLVRQFETPEGAAPIEPYQAGGRWTYSGNALTGGASARFGRVARLAGSVTWSGTLTATASEDTAGGDVGYTIPLEIRLGASALLSPSIMVNASYATADWTETAQDLSSDAPLTSATSYGFGLELAQASLIGRRTPLRFGYRSTDLPFQLAGGAVTETAYTGGLGLVLNEQSGLILASVDLGIERGERKDLDLVERFWRATLTVRVAGF
jgi:hypothetical protein